MRSYRVLVLSAIVACAHAGVTSAQSAPGVLSAADTAMACAPSLTRTPPAVAALRIAGSQDSIPRTLFGSQDIVVVTGGTQAGVQLDQEYFIRRPHLFGRQPSGGLHTVHTLGWLKIVAVNDTTAIAQIEASCDGVSSGDYLEPFAAPVVPAAADTPAPVATLDFSALGRVMFGREERRTGAVGDFMLVNPGDAALAPGSRVALYRDLQTPGVPLTSIGEGIVVSVSNGAPVMRIVVAREAVESGDYVVLHK